MSAEIISLADRREKKTGARTAPSEVDKKRLIALLIRDIAFDLGRGEEMNRKYGRLEPLPGDERLRAMAPSFSLRGF